MNGNTPLQTNFNKLITENLRQISHQLNTRYKSKNGFSGCLYTSHYRFNPNHTDRNTYKKLHFATLDDDLLRKWTELMMNVWTTSLLYPDLGGVASRWKVF